MIDKPGKYTTRNESLGPATVHTVTDTHLEGLFMGLPMAWTRQGTVYMDGKPNGKDLIGYLGPLEEP